MRNASVTAPKGCHTDSIVTLGTNKQPVDRSCIDTDEGHTIQHYNLDGDSAASVPVDSDGPLDDHYHHSDSAEGDAMFLFDEPASIGPDLTEESYSHEHSKMNRAAGSIYAEAPSSSTALQMIGCHSSMNHSESLISATTASIPDCDAYGVNSSSNMSRSDDRHGSRLGSDGHTAEYPILHTLNMNMTTLDPLPLNHSNININCFASSSNKQRGDVKKERKRRKSATVNMDRNGSMQGEKKSRIGPTGREIFVFDDAGDQRLLDAVGRYFPLLSDKRRGLELDDINSFDNQQSSSSSSFSTSSVSYDQSVGGDGLLLSTGTLCDSAPSVSDIKDKNQSVPVAVGRGFQKVKWLEVAAYVGSGWQGVPVLPHQCEFRWNNHLDPSKEGLRAKGPWTEADDGALCALLQAQRTQKNFRGAYDWNSISSILGRSTVTCQHRKTTLSRKRQKKGPFTPEEDQIILRIIRTWDNNGVSEVDENGVPADINGFSGGSRGNSIDGGEEGYSGNGEEGPAGSAEKRGKKDSTVSVGRGAGGVGADSEARAPRKGKWVAVGDALNRPSDCCSQRYRDTLAKRPPDSKYY